MEPADAVDPADPADPAGSVAPAGSADSADFVVVLPAKPPAVGKSRLGAAAGERRHALAEAFALDTAAACLAARRVRGVLAVTDDAALGSRLVAKGCGAIPDGDASGLNPALRQGAAEAVRRWPGARPVAVLADLPALRPADLDAALGAVAEHLRRQPDAAAYVADAAGTGTVLYTASAHRFDPAFGAGSAAAHRAAGAWPVPGELRTLRHDVDDGDDLAAAVLIGVGPATARIASG
ncbi:2-phospho-L-lactate guanylyltransferase [Nocardioides marinquilinus]|uniref:2-phospho-L-lactate guanylyltransferase n=1 Tax=Nocardioides marinquilinus TaxID=1210400 RepID=UPI0031EF699B